LIATFAVLAFAAAGPTAAPMATVLMASAATTAISVRVIGDCDDISTLPFLGLLPMFNAIQVLCQSRKTAKNDRTGGSVGNFANQDLVDFATRDWEHSPAPARRTSELGIREYE
jgi:hypothetical protein